MTAELTAHKLCRFGPVVEIIRSCVYPDDPFATFDKVHQTFFQLFIVEFKLGGIIQAYRIEFVEILAFEHAHVTADGRLPCPGLVT